MFPIANRLPIIFPFIHRSIHVTPVFYAEPLKKKKVISPLILKKQFEKKVRKYEREINRLEAIPPKLKPILELQLPPNVLKNLDIYKRTNTDENCHKLLKRYYKIWCIYKNFESQMELIYIKSVVEAQKKALDILEKEYPNLYEKAIQIDPNLIPYQVQNVKKQTAPSESYQCPDGKHTDITKEWRL